MSRWLVRPGTVMHARALLVVAALWSCSDRTTPDDHEASSPMPDAGSPSESSGESDGSVTCRDGLAACGGACVDLETDDANCGTCDHMCKEPETFGHCEAGACPSALYCTARNTSLRSCNDVCAAHGQRCDEWTADSEAGDRGCAGDRYMFYDASG